jgi:hypothetical protein
LLTRSAESTDYRKRLSTLDSSWIEWFDKIEPYIFGDKRDNDIRSDFFAAIQMAKEGRVSSALYWKDCVDKTIGNKCE